MRVRTLHVIRKRGMLLLGLLPLCSAIAAASSVAAAEWDWARLYEGIRTYEESISSLHAKSDVRILYDKDKEGQAWLWRQYELTMEGERIRLDLAEYKKDCALSGRSATVLDGHTCRSLNPGVGVYSDRAPFAVIKTANAQDFFGTMFGMPCLLGRYRGFDSPAKAMQRVGKGTSISLERLDAEDVVCLEIADRDMRHIYRFSPARALVLVQWQEYTKSGLYFDHRNTKYMHFADAGVWIPVEGVTTIPNGGDSYQAFTKCSDVHLNEAVGDSVFEIEFPIGTLVADQIEKRTYPVGADVSRAAKEIEKSVVNEAELSLTSGVHRLKLGSSQTMTASVTTASQTVCDNGSNALKTEFRGSGARAWMVGAAAIAAAILGTAWWSVAKRRRLFRDLGERSREQ